MLSQSGRKLNILHIIDTFSMGGAETWLMELLRFWHRQGLGAPQIDIIATSGNAGIFDDEARALGARVFYLPFSRSKIVSFVRSFREILKLGKYDAIHDHQGSISGWHFLLGIGLLPAVRVSHVHNSILAEQNRSTLGHALAMWTGKRLIAYCSTHICGTSRQLITEYGFGARRFGDLTKAACYCGIDTSRFVGDAAAEKASVCREFGWPGDAKIILVAGRMDVSTEIGHRYNHKNSAFAVSVAIQCARQDSRVHALFAGWRIPTVVSVLEQRIAAQGLAERIQFVGVRRDIERFMLASDVLLFPSRAEGLGMVAVEAQAAGLPVLASTAVPRECLVVPELVQFRDVNAGKEAEWAANLLQLAAQPRNIIYANQRVAASEFAIEHSALTLLRLYSKGCRFQKPDLGVPVI